MVDLGSLLMHDEMPFVMWIYGNILARQNITERVNIGYCIPKKLSVKIKHIIEAHHF